MRRRRAPQRRPGQKRPAPRGRPPTRSPSPEVIASGDHLARVVLESPYVMLYPTARAGDGSEFYKISGRVMGGGSSVNAMAVVRPTKHDLDSWAALGNPGWSFDDCLPLLKRIETDADYGGNDIHGEDGPLYVKRLFKVDEEASAPVRAFIDRALAMGLPMCPDLNVPNPYGVCSFRLQRQRRRSPKHDGRISESGARAPQPRGGGGGARPVARRRQRARERRRLRARRRAANR